MISTAKSYILKPDTRSTMSLKISVPVSTGKEKDLTPYWNESCRELSKKLLSHIKTDFVDLDLSCWNESAPFTVQKSWFSTTQYTLPSMNSQQISSQSYTSSPAVFAALESMLIRSKKIRIYPNNESLPLFKRFLGLSRWWYNQGIAHLKQPETKASLYDLRSLQYKEDFPIWSLDCPQRIREHTLSDAAIAVKSAKRKFKKTKQFQDVKFRKKRSPKQSFGFDACSLKQNQIFSNKQWKITFYASENYEHLLENVKEGTRVVLENGRWFLVIPHSTPIKQPENQRHGVVAIDPGVRTFITMFSEDFSGKIGSGDFSRIYRLCVHQDKLISKISKSKGLKKLNQKKALHRLRWKIKDLISDLHHKSAKFLCSNFDVILLPTFETSEMVKKSKRKIRSKTARSMLTFSHYKFKQFLKAKAEEMNCVVVDVNEAYTSKTCSFCGKIQNIGSKKTLKCSCGIEVDRDINGARGIYLRALGATPFNFNEEIDATADFVKQNQA